MPVPLLALATACTSATGGTGGTPTADTATTLMADHSGYLPPDLPQPTPGPVDVVPNGGAIGGYELAMVVAGPGEWDRFAATEQAAGCPHFRDDNCWPLPDSAALHMKTESSWLVFTPDRFGHDWEIHSAEVTEDGFLAVTWGFCGDGDNLELSGRVYAVPRAGYAGVLRITQASEDTCRR